MLAADGVTVAASCLASSSPSGELKLGGTTVHTGVSNLRLGVLDRSGVYTLTGGGIVAAPVDIPGGLLGLMCPSEVPAVSEICDAVVGSDLNRVTAVLEAAGTPTGFDLGAGSNCYIGPILLRPANLTRPTPQFVRFNADGTANPTGEMGYVSTSGVSQGDSTFAVPEADGCGLAGLLDGAVNLKQGLPSPAGTNSVVLTNTSTQVGGFFTPSRFAPTQGKQLSDRWHAAVLPSAAAADWTTGPGGEFEAVGHDIPLGTDGAQVVCETVLLHGTASTVGNRHMVSEVYDPATDTCRAGDRVRELHLPQRDGRA